MVIELSRRDSHFVEVTDEWFFNGHDLHVDYNKEKDELEFFLR